MNIEYLAIELTRRCNMQCPHCLRGNAQNLDLDTEYVKTLFQKIDGIGTLTLSGGEPTLVPHIINEIVSIAEYYEVDISNFYIVTNAKEITKEFIFAAIELYTYCSDNEISQVQWSNDAYHDELNRDNIELLKTLSFASPRNEHDDMEYVLIDEGRATDYSNVYENRQMSQNYFDYDFASDYLMDGTLYLNCDGNVIAGCDWSYENQDHNIICHVDDFDDEKVLNSLEITIGEHAC